MLSQSDAIVLHTIKYGETSLVVQAFTRMYGRLGFMVNGVRSRKSGSKVALFQPLSILELHFYYKEKEQLMRVREAALARPLHSLYADWRKASLAVFLCEVLTKTIREHQADETMWQFLTDRIAALADCTTGLGVYPLHFVVQLTHTLGIAPDFSTESLGYFTDQKSNRPGDESIISLLQNIYTTSLEEIHAMNIPYELRMTMLQYLLMYVHNHFGKLLPLRSPEVLHEVFSRT